jgi:hypothetical protein
MIVDYIIGAIAAIIIFYAYYRFAKRSETDYKDLEHEQKRTMEDYKCRVGRHAQ